MGIAINQKNSSAHCKYSVRVDNFASAPGAEIFTFWTENDHGGITAMKQIHVIFCVHRDISHIAKVNALWDVAPRAFYREKVFSQADHQLCFHSTSPVSCISTSAIAQA
jgi:hypothetical protein